MFHQLLPTPRVPFIQRVHPLIVDPRTRATIFGPLIFSKLKPSKINPKMAIYLANLDLVGVYYFMTTTSENTVHSDVSGWWTLLSFFYRLGRSLRQLRRSRRINCMVKRTISDGGTFGAITYRRVHIVTDSLNILWRWFWSSLLRSVIAICRLQSRGRFTFAPRLR
jgi:hypothetical protein